MLQTGLSATKTPNHSEAVRTAFAELDWQQLIIFAHHSPARRLQMMFDLIEFARGLVIASERQRAPHIPEDELARRVCARIQLSYDP
jgi:hypothetical protein